METVELLAADQKAAYGVAVVGRASSLCIHARHNVPLRRSCQLLMLLLLLLLLLLLDEVDICLSETDNNWLLLLLLLVVVVVW